MMLLPSAIARRDPAFARVLLALLCAGLSTFGLLYCVQPLLPLFAADFHLDAATASLAVSAATGTLAIGLLFGSALSDRLGRKPIMVGALYLAAALTAMAAMAPTWPLLVIARAIAGLVLAGAPAVAMAYVADELEPEAAGLAMGLYIAGTALGGMLGRLGCGALADLVGWRWAVALIGGAGAVAAALFHWSLPPSRRHRPAPALSLRHRLYGFGAAFRDPGLPWLFAEGGLLMGGFVTVYNYLPFHLLQPPYHLSQAAVGAVFSLYLVGIVSSPMCGEAASRLGWRWVFWAPVALMLAGVGLTLLHNLAAIVTGVGLLTFGFFGAHSIASSWVGRRSGLHKAPAASLYLLVYYLGSSVAGSLGGVFWTQAGWSGVASFTCVLILLALLGAARLMLLPPLRENARPTGVGPREPDQPAVRDL